MLFAGPGTLTHWSVVLHEHRSRRARARFGSVAGQTSGIELQLASKPATPQDGHQIRRLEINLVNKTNERIETYEFEIHLPAGILKHWSSVYWGEVQCNIPGLRCFRFNQEARGAVRPHDLLPNPILFDYCTTCARSPYETKGLGRHWYPK
jgi:hypothetical protein